MPPVGTDSPVVEKATGLRMDPRIARRWVEVRREQGRRRLRVLIGIGIVVLAAALFAGSLYTPLFKVRHVRVAVQGSMPISGVVALSGITGHTLMIRVDDSAVERRLDAVANLGEARVATHWPGTISIRVSVRDAVAVIPVGAQTATQPPSTAPSHWAEIDQTGRVISVVAVRPAGLPQLLGIGDSPAQGQWVAGSPGPAARVYANVQ
ncbi:MAG TPA: FtsQ-type POTRA domain-containing protein, partial [Acidimicrobiales bacterium]|nr:FtsQ-type POTRA domain-containing protein [Acidimicrobiales bacterium]